MQRKGTSLTKLEESLGWSNGYIGKWAQAKKPPTIEKLLLVSSMLEVPISDLTGETEKSPTSEEIGPNKQALLNLIDTMEMPELLEIMQKVTETIQKRGKRE